MTADSEYNHVSVRYIFIIVTTYVIIIILTLKYCCCTQTAPLLKYCLFVVGSSSNLICQWNSFNAFSFCALIIIK